MKRLLFLFLGLVVVVGVAGAGWVAGRQIKSSDQIAAEAEPPEPSLITVEVTKLVISADIVTRGNVRFDQPESVSSQGIALPEVDPVVTWAPEAGFEFTEGTVLYEVAGRPVFALQGDLPLFRSLNRGAEGEDVVQFQNALLRLGFDPGEIDGVYGPDTEAAAEDFYESRGYEILGPTEAEEQELQAAKDFVTDLTEPRDRAKAAATAATAAEALLPPAQAAVTNATTTLTSAEAALAAGIAGGLTAPEIAALEAAVEAAVVALEAATASLDLLTADAEAKRAEADALDLPGAEKALARARSALRDVQGRVGLKVPTAEVVFFELFPLRVDTVLITRGDVVGGEVMRVSGSRLAIDASVDIADAELIEVGDAVMIDLASRGIELTGVVTEKASRPGTNNVSSQEVYIEIVPDEVVAELNEANVRLTIPVESTGGAVLAVPASAISATADGSAQVTVEEEDGSTRFVTVTPGLSSGGLVQITAVDGDLDEGDRVVVGVS